MPSKREKRERARKQKRREDRAAKEAAAEAAQQAGNPGIPHSPASLHGCSHASGCSAGPGSPLPQPSASSSALAVDTPRTPPRMTAGASKCPIA